MSVVSVGQCYQVVLSHRCANACGFCEFASTPSPQIPSQSVVLRHAAIGVEQGADEILLTAGTGIDTHPEVMGLIGFLGCGSWIEYLRKLCDGIIDARFVVDDVPVLPILDCGGLSVADMCMLRRVCPAVQLSVPSMDDELLHRPALANAQGKCASACLKSIEAAGRSGMAVMCSTMVGIGERPESWAQVAQAVSHLHQEFGHVMQLTLMPFSPSPFMKMDQFAPVSDEVLLSSIARVRRSLDSSIVLAVDGLCDRVHLIEEAVRLGVGDLGKFKFGDLQHLALEMPGDLRRLRVRLGKSGIGVESRNKRLLSFIRERELPAKLRGTEIEEELACLLERIFYGSSELGIRN